MCTSTRTPVTKILVIEDVMQYYLYGDDFDINNYLDD